ncbi:MAG: hypothetical protein ACYTEZ_07135 [Planctomycetota bacterium]|jgi:Flp pilus assembly protein TadB
MERRLVLKPDSPWTWLIAVGALTAAVIVAVAFFTFFLALVAVGLVATPFLLWKRKRALQRKDPNVIDIVDYEIGPKLPDE